MPAETNREKIVVDGAFQLDYDTMKGIAERCRGWLRTSGGTSDEAEVWIDDKTYVFKDRGLVEFLYYIKAKHVGQLHEAIHLCEYIAKSAQTPPSVFVRDAIVARAAALKALIEGGSDAG